MAFVPEIDTVFLYPGNGRFFLFDYCPWKGKTMPAGERCPALILTHAYLISKRALLALQLTPVRASIGR